MECLKCGASIEWDNTYDSDTCDNKHIEYCIGHCPECDTIYNWQEIYKFEGQENLKIVT